MKLKLILVLTFLLFANFSFAQLSNTGQKGVVRTQSAQTVKKGRLGIGVSFDQNFDKDFLQGLRSTPSDLDSLNKITSNSPNTFNKTTIGVGLTYGILNWWDFSANLPIYMDQLDNSIPGADGAGVGDAIISMKMQYPPYEHSHIFDMSYFGELSIPTGTENSGFFPRYGFYNLPDPLDSIIYQGDSILNDLGVNADNKFFTAGNYSFLAKMLWTFDAAEINPEVDIKWHINYGVRFTGGILKNMFLASSALEYSPHKIFTLFLDYSVGARFDDLAGDIGAFKNEPMFLSTGLRMNVPGGTFITIAYDHNFTDNDKYYYKNDGDDKGDNIYSYKTKAAPSKALYASISWVGSLLGLDADKDGIPDKIDNCPNEPEDVDGFEDADGCPDVDNDRDGIIDIQDRCPERAEDFDNFEDQDGCPDLDNDKDGILDEKDKCPTDAEDKDGFEDADGCPDFDNDKDAVVDSLDKCPNQKEDIDGFKDKDGCPDLDNDGDGILDSLDKCPNKKENINGFQDQDGCPDVKPVAKPKKKFINKGSSIKLKNVRFKTGTAELTFDAQESLDAVAQAILEQEKAIYLEVRGYTDNRGSPKKLRKLSKKRAEAVVKYLTSKGIDSKTLRAKGFGPKHPIADNKTSSGRKENRRIEMYRVKK